MNPRVQRFVPPPHTLLREVCAWLSHLDVIVGAQNMHWQDEGPWTGEISAPMLLDCGVNFVELGHSERRTHFVETDHTIRMKVSAALKHGLTPLICVGEKAGQINQADAVLEQQVRSALVHAPRGSELLIAYEPAWAIGKEGVAAEPEYADARQARIKSVAEDMLEISTPSLYGGSVDADNCAQFIGQPAVDGLFIGRAAWPMTRTLPSAPRFQITRKC
ncbi:MAG: triose-phosphate isomerase [Paracoccaceae bacterium]